MTLRRRILVASFPCSPCGRAGRYGAVLIYRLGDGSTNPPRELRQRDLHAGPERGPGAHRLVIPVCPGRPRRTVARAIKDNWNLLREEPRQRAAQHHLPGEGQLADKLTALERRYRQQGDAFFARPTPSAPGYFGRRTAGSIRHVPRDQGRLGRDPANQPRQHGKANGKARRMARSSLVLVRRRPGSASPWPCCWCRTIRTILHPIRAVTESARRSGRATSINSCPSPPRMSWGNWPAPSTPWPASFASTVSRTRPS